MREIALLALLLLLGCGSLPTDTRFLVTGGIFTPPIQHDRDLGSYVTDFIRDAAMHGRIVAPQVLRILKYEVLEEPSVGLCTTYFNAFDDGVAYTEIRIHPKLLRCEPLLRAVMYHELGHCLMQLDHTERGIMKATTYSCEYYAEHWDELVDNFFGRVDE